MRSTKVWGALGVVAVLAACDSAPPTMGDAGMRDGGGGNADTGTPPPGDATVPDGGTPSGCASEAEAFCALFARCHPTGFLLAFESDAICRRVVGARCESPPVIPMSNGLTDEAACEAARSGSCESFFSTFPPIPPACIPLPGDVALSGACFTDLQCGVTTVMDGSMRRMYCRPLMSGGMLVYGTAECPRGECIASQAENASCNPAIQGISQFCDRFAGMACAQQFDMMDGVAPGSMNQCRRIVYGVADDPCFPGTERQCASGFGCDATARRCMAVLGEGQACIPTRDLCDRRLGLTCLDTGSGDVCTGPAVVGVGAQCGMVMVGGRTENRLCSAYARCDTSMTPPVCMALRGLGETCTVSPDNCEPGLECDAASNRCEEPEPTTMCP